MTKGNDHPIALITGASSGIGEALAQCFAGAAHDLVLVARSADKLQALAQRLQNQYQVRALVLPADLSEPGSVERLAATLRRRRRVPDVLVNCAGVLEQQAFTRMRPAAHQAIIDLNISALTAMLSHFLPAMQERRSGRVLNVASIAAFQPIPLLATYAASKAYVLSLTESLSEELRGTGVTVSALCPGITATNMVSAAQQGSPGLKLPDFLVGDAGQVAEDGYDACMRGEVIKVPGAINLAGMLAGRVTPKWLQRRVTGTLGRATFKA